MNRFLVTLALYLLVVASSVFFCLQKAEVLAYHEQDYAYYLQFASKLLDPVLSNQYAVNPMGLNFLGFHGTEGARSFHQGIHFEPVKYLYPLVYHLCHGVWGLFLLLGLVVYAPVLYIARLYPDEKKADRYFAWAWFLAYLVCPLALDSVAFDLRPYNFLAPVFVLAILSIYFRRPLMERMGFFVLLLLIREESLMLAPVAIAYQFCVEDISRRWKSVLPMFGLWLGWGVVTLMYFMWTRYEFTIYIFQSKLIEQNRWLVAAGLAGALLILLAVVVCLGRRERISPALQLTAFSLVFIPLAGQLIMELERAKVSENKSLFDIILHPRMFLYGAVVLIFLMLWRHAMQEKRQVIASWLTAISIPLSAGLYFCPPHSPVIQLMRVADAEAVWKVVQASDRYNTTVLTDYKTFQAFSDFEHIMVYRRLPWYMVPGDGRYYPANLTQLGLLLKEQVQYAVFATSSFSDIQKIYEEAGMSVPNQSANVYQVEAISRSLLR